MVASIFSGPLAVRAALLIPASAAPRKRWIYLLPWVLAIQPVLYASYIFGEPIGATEKLLDRGLWGLEIDPDAEADRHIATVKATMKSLVHPRMYAEVDRQLDLARQVRLALTTITGE